ncbi:MAG: NTP transferase domain-containing protein [Holophagales bacterium]|jgi:NDP-sugar pyrophosphorylase family protein|nr:NTP transferase domain-containing protein [Holophagales bacterium]
MTNNIDAFIFAAGFGTRMGALSSILPKPAWTLKGKPLLQWAADSLRHAGCVKIACNAHHHVNIIKSIAEDIEVIEEKALLGTGEPLRRIASRIATDGLLVWNADVIADVPWTHLRHEHAARIAGVSWLLVPHTGGAWTELYLDSSGRILPRGTTGPKGPYLFTGAACWSAEAASAIPENCFDVRDFLAEYPDHRGVVVEPFHWLEIGATNQLIHAAGKLAPEHEGRVPGCYIHPTAVESWKITRCVLGPGAELYPDVKDCGALWFFDGKNQIRLALE